MKPNIGQVRAFRRALLGGFVALCIGGFSSIASAQSIRVTHDAGAGNTPVAGTTLTFSGGFPTSSGLPDNEVQYRIYRCDSRDMGTAYTNLTGNARGAFGNNCTELTQFSRDTNFGTGKTKTRVFPTDSLPTYTLHSADVDSTKFLYFAASTDDVFSVALIYSQANVSISAPVASLAVVQGSSVEFTLSATGFNNPSGITYITTTTTGDDAPQWVSVSGNGSTTVSVRSMPNLEVFPMNYTFQVVATSGSETVTSVDIQIAVNPKTPEALNVAPVVGTHTASGIPLTWNKTDGANRFEIHISTSTSFASGLSSTVTDSDAGCASVTATTCRYVVPHTTSQLALAGRNYYWVKIL